MFLVHQNSMDVFFEVIRTQYRGPKYRKVKGRWWNLGFTGQPWLCDSTPQTIRILEEDFGTEWKFFDPSKPETHPGRQNV